MSAHPATGPEAGPNHNGPTASPLSASPSLPSLSSLSSSFSSTLEQPEDIIATTSTTTITTTTTTTSTTSVQSVLHLEPDSSTSDTDSAFGSFFSSTSTSLASSIWNYEYSNGRRYHAYRSGAYVLPNDEQEQDRLDLLHHIFLLILGGKLYDAPLGPAPARVLDIGTGTGIWAIDFADENPGSEVIGTDLSPIQPSWTPPNAKFYIDDAESEWLYSPAEAFNFIHVRTMSGSITDWDRLMQQSFTHLAPGGWLEFQEPIELCESDDGTIEKADIILKWQALCADAAKGSGIELSVGLTLKQRMIQAGFVDVSEKIIKVPVGPWPKDSHMKEIGRYQREHLAVGIEPYTLGFMGKLLGWSEAECRVIIAKAMADVRNRNLHLYIRFCFVHGRKPK